MSQQFLREASLFVLNGVEALDLSQLHFTFEVSAADVETPNNATIRVFNMSPVTEKTIKNQYNKVILQVGYRGSAKGTIFAGTIIQVRRGKLNNIDRYTDIVAADSDVPYNFGKVKKTLAAGSNTFSQISALNDALREVGADEMGYVPQNQFTGGILPRGKVLYGLARKQLRNIANSAGTSWSLQNGRLQMVPLTGYLPGQAVVLTAKTGLIGMPEQTDNGMEVTCLINPLIQTGGLIKLDNATINEAKINIDFTAINLFADKDTDGFYKVLVMEYRGDTRGNEWYQYLTCLAVNPAAKENPVNPYAG